MINIFKELQKTIYKGLKEKYENDIGSSNCIDTIKGSIKVFFVWKFFPFQSVLKSTPNNRYKNCVNGLIICTDVHMYKEGKKKSITEVFSYY